MELNEMYDQLIQTGLYRIQKKYTFKKTYNKNLENKVLKKASVVDVETTGLNSETDEIINIAVVQFSYDDSGTVYSITNMFSGFQEPSTSISAEITKLTGITNSMVAGKKFDKKKINELLEDSDFIIAHNCSFDYSFLIKMFPVVEQKIWCDTLTQIPWDDFEVKGKKLENIAYFFSFFFDAHLALNDCLALLELLTRELGEKTVLTYLLETLKSEQTIVKAVGSPFGKNTLLKDKKYDFNSSEKTWYKLLTPDKVKDEMNFLEQEIYSGKNKAVCETVSRMNLFKNKR